MARPILKVNKNGVEAYQAQVRIKGFDPVYKTRPTLAEAEEYQKDAEKLIRKEQRANLDPRSWLPASGEFREQRLRDVLRNFGAQLPKSAWQHATLSAVLNVCGNPTIEQLHPVRIQGVRDAATPRPTLPTRQRRDQSGWVGTASLHAADGDQPLSAALGSRLGGAVLSIQAVTA